MIKKLTDEIVLRSNVILNNRIAMAPMQTSSAHRGGTVSEDTLKYYAARSKAAGLLITEFHYVSKNGGPSYSLGYPEQLAVYDDVFIPGLKKIASSLKKDGNKAVLQIHHAGRRANGWAVSGEEVLAPSSMEMTSSGYPVREMTDEEIVEIIKDFGNATRRAIEAGFDGVEIHGANHYLLQQFFSKTTNKRNDRWGGTIEKRMEFPLAVVKEVKKVIAEKKVDNFIVGYRISPEEIHGETVGYTYNESLKLISEVIKEELDYIHLSLWDGYASKPKDSEKSYAQLFDEILDDQTKLIIVGGVFNEDSAKDAVANYADIIAIGRGTLIDPEFAYKIENNLGHTIYEEISPEIMDYVKWSKGLKEALSRRDALGLPKLPGGASIEHLHTGCFDMLSKVDKK